MSSKLKRKRMLSTWKEIADYLDCDIRTCRRWEGKYGLPVHRIDETSNARVYAYENEIDQWLNRNSDSKRKYKRSSKPLILKKISYVFLLLIPTVFIYLFLIQKKDVPQPVNFRLDKSTLIILDEKNKEIGRFDTEVKNLISENFYRDRFQIRQRKNGVELIPYIIISDLDQDNKKEILISIQTVNEFGEGDLICLDSKGNMLWNFETGKELKFGNKVYSNDYKIFGFETIDINDDGNLEIVLISEHILYFPTQLIVLNHKGSRLGEYWNSGRLAHYNLVDLNNDGTKEMVLVGMNNEYKKGCLIVFDLNNIKGSSPQSKDNYKCSSLEPGSEKFYILFPRTDVDMRNTETEAMILIEPLNNQRLSVKSQVGKIYFELDFNFVLLAINFSDDFRQLHKQLFEEKKISSKLDSNYEMDLLKGLLYFDSKNWIAKPSMSNPW